MKRRAVIAITLVLVALPAAFALRSAASFSARNRNNGSIVSSGEKREYILHVPRSYDRSKAAPLVISLHGAGGWPAQQLEVSGWNAVADREGFIVVYPAGAQRAGPRVWHVEKSGDLEKDVRFISQLIDKIEGDYNVDRDRIYANGLSNGGGMSFVLSCTISDRIAAVGLVAAARTLPWRWCSDSTPVPMIAFHGTADPVVPYNGGTSLTTPGWPSVPIFTANWARRNRCADEPAETAMAPDITRREYRACAGDATVVLYTVRGGGHTWPGGGPLPEWLVGPTNREIDATRLMWSFFRAHPLSRRR